MVVSLELLANSLIDENAGGQTVTSPPFTPNNGRTIIVMAISHENNVTDLTISDSFGQGWTWNTRIAFGTGNTAWTPDVHYKVWSTVASGSPGSGDITIDDGGLGSNGWNLVVGVVSGHNSSSNDGIADTSVVTGAASTGPATGSLNGTSGNAILAVCIVDADVETSLAPDSPLSEQDGGDDTAPQCHTSVAFSSSEDASPSFDWTNSREFLAIFVEIAAAEVSTTPVPPSFSATG